MEDFKLEMLGFGSAFNSVEYGNTSGYFESDDSIYIIDCGSTVFNEILRRKLDLSKTINLIITHTHTDHIGSVGTFVEYSYFALGNKLDIFCAKEIESSLITILLASGVTNEMFNIHSHHNNTLDIDENINITFYEVNHVDTLKTFAIVLKEKENDRQLIYSGDINNYDDLKEMFISMIYKNVSSIYLDFSLNNSPVHENSLENLEQIIELFENSNIYLMHLDNTIEEYEWKLRKHYSDKKIKVAK